MQEQQLIAGVLAGDPRAERELYDLHVDRVYRLAYRMTGDPQMAEDYTQETFIRTFGKLDTFQGRSALGTWIHSIAVSVVLDGLRKVKRLRNRETEVADGISDFPGRPAPDTSLKLRLHNAIDRLPEEMRVVVVMHDIEGFKHHEISEAIGVPVGTTKSRLFRARQILRDALGGTEGFAQEDLR